MEYGFPCKKQSIRNTNHAVKAFKYIKGVYCLFVIPITLR